MIDWFGHGGASQGFISQTVVIPQHQVTLSIVTNTIERMANSWVDGAIRIIAGFAAHGAASERVRSWTGR